MALEDLTGPDKGLDALVVTNPDGLDPKSEGDNHARGTKNVLVNTFGPMEASSVSLPADGEVLTWDTDQYKPQPIPPAPVQEAPIDGKQYARKDAAWAEVAPDVARVVYVAPVPATGAGYTFPAFARSDIRAFTLGFRTAIMGGSSDLKIQIGPAAGLETTDYRGTTTNDSGSVRKQWSDAVIAEGLSVDNGQVEGSIRGELIDPAANLWSFRVLVNTGTVPFYGMGTKAIAGKLDLLRVFQGGGETQKGGSYNLVLEY